MKDFQTGCVEALRFVTVGVSCKIASSSEPYLLPLKSSRVYFKIVFDN